MDKNKAVIMVGGDGTRLWPFSTKERPKFMLPLKSNNPLVIDIYNDLRSVFGEKNVYFCSRSDKKNLLYSLFEEYGISNSQLIIESDNRKGTFATCEQCFDTLGYDKNILFCGGDAFFTDSFYFKGMISSAYSFMKRGDRTILFGQKATGPNTNFGYISKDLDGRVEFTEKPDIVTARLILDYNKNAMWNMGMTFLNGSIFKNSINKIIESTGFNPSEKDGISIDKGFLEYYHLHTGVIDVLRFGLLLGEETWFDVGILENLKNKNINREFVILIKHYCNDKTMVIEKSVVDNFHDFELAAMLNSINDGQTIYISKYGRIIV